MRGTHCNRSKRLTGMSRYDVRVCQLLYVAQTWQARVRLCHMANKAQFVSCLLLPRSRAGARRRGGDVRRQHPHAAGARCRQQA